MAAVVLINRAGAAVAVESIAQFRASCRGVVIGPADAEYDTARRIWNASIDKRPGLIARCSGLADVIAAVNFARDHDLLVAIRGGGHNVGGRALCDGGLVIDLSRMKGVHVDPRAGRVRVQPGVMLGELDRETHVYGMAVPAGVVSKTGVAGLTLGGGVGWLVKKYGLTCDNVISFEIVTADGAGPAGQRRRAPRPVLGAARRRRQLRCRDLVRVPPAAGQHGARRHARPSARPCGGAAAALSRLHRRRAGRAGHLLGMIHTPDGTPVTAFVTCYSGDLADGEKLLAPLRKFGPPLMDAIPPIPFPQMQTRSTAPSRTATRTTGSPPSSRI